MIIAAAAPVSAAAASLLMSESLSAFIFDGGGEPASPAMELALSLSVP